MQTSPTVELWETVAAEAERESPLWGAALRPLAEQEHVVYGVVNLDLGPAWEFNLGYGTALTGAGDKKLVKLILGRRVGK